MVLPLIPVALGVSALATAVTGLKKAWDAKQNYSKAQDWVDASKRELSEAAESLESRREEVCTQLNAVAMLRMQIISKSIKKFSDLMDQVAGSDFAEINVDGHEIAVEVVPQSELATASYQATDFLQQIPLGVVFNAFGDHLQVEAMCQLNDGGDHAAIFRHAIDKHLIDFEYIHRQRLHML